MTGARCLDTNAESVFRRRNGPGQHAVPARFQRGVDVDCINALHAVKNSFPDHVHPTSRRAFLVRLKQYADRTAEMLPVSMQNERYADRNRRMCIMAA